jgi:ferredoxin-NADP reductase
MAEQKLGTVRRSEDQLGARLIELELERPLGFVGGQYVIVNSGVQLGDGKLAKRAYSIVSADESREQQRLLLAVKQIDQGPASSWLRALKIGDQVPFSGPWGKFLPDDARPRAGTWVIATDTGITAALGLVRGRAFAPQLAAAQLLWLVESEDYFLPDAWVRGEVPASLRYRRAPLPPSGHPARVDAALAMVRELLHDGAPESVFLSGDGAVLYPLRELFGTAGVDEGSVRLEAFFNNPQRKSV